MPSVDTPVDVPYPQQQRPPEASGPGASFDAAADPRSMALSWRGVRKTFGDTIAVSDMSLDIPRGSFYGIVGPNGAGKTTAITIATGLLRPDAGQVFVAGFNPWEGQDREAKSRFGLLADGLPVFDRLTGQEYLDYLGRLRGMDDRTIASRSQSLLGALGLDEAAGKMIIDYSAGMTKKILLAGALLHAPDVLILDEPLEAVDPVSSTVIRGILRAFVANGGTVVMSSHVMELVENTCDHVALISAGTVRAAGTVDEVRGNRSLAEAFVDLVGGATWDTTGLEWLGHHPGDQPGHNPGHNPLPAEGGDR